MKRMNTFLLYTLVIVAFFFVSNFLIDGLISQMYKELASFSDGDSIINETGLDVDIKVTNASATNVNGNIVVELTNNSNETINDKYLKFDLYTDTNDKPALTRYMEVNDLKPGETREYKLKFNAGYIKRYTVALVDEFPDKDYIFDVFGYEINTKNIFGFDVSKYIDANKMNDFFGGGAKGLIGGILNFFGNVLNGVWTTAQRVPLWAYLIAWCIFAGVL